MTIQNDSGVLAPNPRLKSDVENARLLGLAFSPRLSRMALDFFLTER